MLHMRGWTAAEVHVHALAFDPSVLGAGPSRLSGGGGELVV